MLVGEKETQQRDNKTVNRGSISVPWSSRLEFLFVQVYFLLSRFLQVSTRSVSLLSQVSAVLRRRLDLHLMYHSTAFVSVNACILVG